MRICTRQRADEQGAAPPGRLLALAALLLTAAVTTLELWAATPGWLLPARQRTVDALHWTKEHWLSATAITTATAVAGVLVPFLIRWLDRRHPKLTVEQQRLAQPRLVMLKRVRHKWITGVLEASLAQGERLACGLVRRPDAVDLGARAPYRPGRPPRPFPESTPISQVFDQVGGGLLILGTPGTGKTTALLRLCGELLDRAEHDPALPIPVVVNLAPWARERRPLGAWLVDELADGYRVPRRIARAWVEQDALALLLDGLDEVAAAHRAACAEAANAWRREHVAPVVVCSRTQELQALGARLQLEEAVELQPPSDAEVGAYLGRLEAAGAPLADLRAALASDQELRELLRSPLMLHTVALAYQAHPAPALHAPGTLAERQARLWAAYVARMFEQRPLDPDRGATAGKALGWLAWLARALQDHNQSEFQLDRVDLDWLPTRTQQRLTRLTLGLAFGLPGLLAGLAGGLQLGLWVGLVSGLTGSMRDERARPNEGVRRSAQHGLLGGLLAGLALGTISWLAYATGAGLAGGLGAGLAGSRGLLAGLRAGLAFALVFGGDAWVYHYAVRAALSRANAAPWRYGAFLEAMAERLLLHRSGSAYLFAHQLLRDYLADRSARPTAELGFDAGELSR